MSSDLLVAIVYDLLLYVGLGLVGLPVAFFLLWTFFDFWKKHIVFFYVMFVVVLAAAVAGFYFTNHYWIYWYYPFPSCLQIIGLLLIVFAFIVINLSEMTISIPVRMFYTLLKGKQIHLKTDGLYKYLRHPIYAVFPWVVFGTMLYTGQLILIPVFLLNLLARHWYAAREEIYLRNVVIGDYDKYKKQTPTRFYPSFSKKP